MTSSDIKDKTDITNARKEIERRMERFKLVEKEAKTKSFSKEGLNRAALDPKERARAEMRDWLSATVDTLNTQVGGAQGVRLGRAGRGSRRGSRVNGGLVAWLQRCCLAGARTRMQYHAAAVHSQVRSCAAHSVSPPLPLPRLSPDRGV